MPTHQVTFYWHILSDELPEQINYFSLTMSGNKGNPTRIDIPIGIPSSFELDKLSLCCSDGTLSRVATRPWTVTNFNTGEDISDIVKPRWTNMDGVQFYGTQYGIPQFPVWINTYGSMTRDVPSEVSLETTLALRCIDFTGPNGIPDGKVDMREVAAASTNFGKPITLANRACDINADGKIDMKDVGTVQRAFGWNRDNQPIYPAC